MGNAVDAAVLSAMCGLLAARPFAAAVGDGLTLFHALADAGSLGAAAAGGDASAGDVAVNGAGGEAAAAVEVACCLAELLRAWAAAEEGAARHGAAANALLARLGYQVDARVELFPAAGRGNGCEEVMAVRRRKP
jgi:hypothetical protein